MKKKNLIFVTILSFLCLVFMFSDTVKAEEILVPSAVDNLVTGLRKKSSLTVTENGYMRVYRKRAESPLLSGWDG